MAYIDSDLCIYCGACLEECSVDAIQDWDEYCYIVEEECMGCGACAEVCPVEAISFDGNEYFDYINSEFDTSSFWSESEPNWTGVPYLEGGYTTNGVDCSFLVYLIYSENGLFYPYYTTIEFVGNPYFYEVLSPLEGDVVIWPGHHMGIYIPDPPIPGNHLYSATSSGGVRYTTYDYWVNLYGNPRFFRRSTGGGGNWVILSDFSIS